LLIAVVAIIAGKLKISTIPFLIILGMLLGPHQYSLFGYIFPQAYGKFDFTFATTGDPTATVDLIGFLGEIGVLFLLFYIGLEFSVSKLIKSGKSIVFGGSVYVLINFFLGLGYGFLTGFALYETLIIAGMLAVSSTAIVAKVLVDLKRTGNKETELTLGIILFDDLFLAVFLAVMSGILFSDANSIGGIFVSVGLAVIYMLSFFVIARVGRPLLDKLLNIKSNEIFIIVVFALLFFIAGVSKTFNVAGAIGALLFGLALSETKHSDRIEHLVVPFRDFFGAMFFFSFGLKINPAQLGDAVWLALGAVVLTVIGNTIAGLVAGRSAGLSYKASMNIGLTLSARGEFTIIIATLGLSAGLSTKLQPFTALYVLTLAILAPILAKNSKHIHGALDKVFGWSKKEADVKTEKAQ